MVRVELDTVIARPIDDVFGRLTDLSDYSRWMPTLGVFIRSGQTSEGPVGRGDHLLRQGMDGHLSWRNRGVSRAHQSRVQGEAPVARRDRHGSETGVRAGVHADRHEVHHTAEGRLFGIFNRHETAGRLDGSRGTSENGPRAEGLSRTGALGLESRLTSHTMRTWPSPYGFRSYVLLYVAVWFLMGLLGFDGSTQRLFVGTVHGPSHGLPVAQAVAHRRHLNNEACRRAAHRVTVLPEIASPARVHREFIATSLDSMM